MKTFHHLVGGTILVGDTRIPLELFVQIERDYQLPHDCHSMIYDPVQEKRVYHRVPMTASPSIYPASYSVMGRWEDGDRYLAREAEFAALVKTERAEWAEAHQAAADARDAAKTPVERRMAEYPSHGELVVALWEMVMENDLRKAYTLQRLREQIKAKYPKEPTQCQQSTPVKNSSTTA